MKRFYFQALYIQLATRPHKKLIELLDQGKSLPFEIKGAAIYYSGPCPAPPGAPIGPCGPTTSYRMDAFTPALLNKGLKIMIGKGERNAEVVESMQKNGALYLAATGGGRRANHGLRNKKRNRMLSRAWS